jgi:hypothetical protein
VLHAPKPESAAWVAALEAAFRAAGLYLLDAASSLPEELCAKLWQWQNELALVDDCWPGFTGFIRAAASDLFITTASWTEPKVR